MKRNLQGELGELEARSLIHRMLLCYSCFARILHSVECHVLLQLVYIPHCVSEFSGEDRGQYMQYCCQKCFVSFEMLCSSTTWRLLNLA